MGSYPWTCFHACYYWIPRCREVPSSLQWCCDWTCEQPPWTSARDCTILLCYLVAAIGTAELGRAKTGWEEPVKALKTNADVEGKTWLSKLNDDYYPGDIGFDPLGLKPTDG